MSVSMMHRRSVEKNSLTNLTDCLDSISTFVLLIAHINSSTNYRLNSDTLKLEGQRYHSSSLLFF